VQQARARPVCKRLLRNEFVRKQEIEVGDQHRN
jgi:hypothetical protein